MRHKRITSAAKVKLREHKKTREMHVADEVHHLPAWELSDARSLRPSRDATRGRSMSYTVARAVAKRMCG